MGNLCSKDDTKKKKKEDEEQPDAGSRSEGTDDTSSTNVTDDADEYPEEEPANNLALRKREVTEPYAGAGHNFGSEFDELSTPATRDGDDKANSVATRDDLFPKNQDKQLNMRIGADKYGDLKVDASSSVGGGENANGSDGDATSAELHSLLSSSAYPNRTPERQRGAASVAEREGDDYNPMRFQDEDTSIVEHRSDAFETPREHLTESISRASASNFGGEASLSVRFPKDDDLMGKNQQPPTRPPIKPAAAPASAPVPAPVTVPLTLANVHDHDERDNIVSPDASSPDMSHKPLERFASAVSMSSFTVTTVRNNSKTIVAPKSSPALHAQDAQRRGVDSANHFLIPVALSDSTERSYPPPRDNAFYSCRSDATLATTKAISPRLPRPAPPFPTNYAPPPPASDAMFLSCRSLESLSSQSVAALHQPPRVGGGDIQRNGSRPQVGPGHTGPRPLIVPAKTDDPMGQKPTPKKSAVVRRSVPKKPRKLPVAETALDNKANVVKTMPATLPLPKPRPASSPTESSHTATNRSSTHNPVAVPVPAVLSASATPRVQQQQQQHRGGGVVVVQAAAASPSEYSLAPPPSSAFQSFPPTPSMLQDSVSYGSMDRGSPKSNRRITPHRGASPAGYMSPTTTATALTARDGEELDSVAFRSALSPSDITTTITATTAPSPTARLPVGEDTPMPSPASNIREPMQDSSNNNANAGNGHRKADEGEVAAAVLSDPSSVEQGGQPDTYPVEEAEADRRASATRPTQVYRDVDTAPTAVKQERSDAGSTPQAAAPASPPAPQVGVVRRRSLQNDSSTNTNNSVGKKPRAKAAARGKAQVTASSMRSSKPTSRRTSATNVRPRMSTSSSTAAATPTAGIHSRGSAGLSSYRRPEIVGDLHRDSVDEERSSSLPSAPAVSGLPHRLGSLTQDDSRSRRQHQYPATASSATSNPQRSRTAGSRRSSAGSSSLPPTHNPRRSSEGNEIFDAKPRQAPHDEEEEGEQQQHVEEYPIEMTTTAAEVQFMQMVREVDGTTGGVSEPGGGAAEGDNANLVPTSDQGGEDVRLYEGLATSSSSPSSSSVSSSFAEAEGSEDEL